MDRQFKYPAKDGFPAMGIAPGIDLTLERYMGYAVTVTVEIFVGERKAAEVSLDMLRGWEYSDLVRAMASSYSLLLEPPTGIYVSKVEFANTKNMN